MIDVIRSEVGKAFGRAVNLIRRGVIKLVSDTSYMQIEASDGEYYDDAEFWQQAGFSSRPPSGSESLFVNVGGNGEHAICFATEDRRYRPSSLAYGDSVHHAITSTSSQARAHAKADGDYDIHAGTSKTVNIGDIAGNCEKMLLGATFDTANRTMLADISAAFTAIGAAVPAAAAACTTAVNSITTFLAGSYQATVGKVK